MSGIRNVGRDMKSEAWMVIAKRELGLVPRDKHSNCMYVRPESIRIAPSSSPPPTLDRLPMPALPPGRKLTLRLFPTFPDRLRRIGAIEPRSPVRGVKNVAFTATALSGEEVWPRSIESGHV